MNPDPAEALEDARPTVAFYGGIQQYESFFEAHGFGAEARRLQAAMKSREVFRAGSLVPDEMARTFVQCGRPDDVRKQVERLWSIADSLVLVPPFWGATPEKLAFYEGMLARTFYE